ncbi:MAG: hypothetical protein H6757_06395 [Candidatus Omnitrophica bacterium]|nr:hypothetical protein [Candidatus Omnitrophota bacterium]
MTMKQYEIVADLFRYPENDFLQHVEYVEGALLKDYPDAAQEIDLFLQQISSCSIDQLEELYTRTFDVQAVTTLDVGYVLFGDDYKRGEILSHLNAEHKKAQVDCGKELADHLPNLLRLVSKLDKSELCEDIVHILLVPALRKMLAEFGAERVTVRNRLYKKHYKTLLESVPNRSGAYYHALSALFEIVKSDFDVKDGPADELLKNDFLNSVKSEMDVEKVSEE